MKNIKIFIVGAGSIGKRHIRNSISIGINPDNIISLDKRDDRLEEVKQLGVKKVFKDFDLATRSLALILTMLKPILLSSLTRDEVKIKLRLSSFGIHQLFPSKQKFFGKI